MPDRKLRIYTEAPEPREHPWLPGVPMCRGRLCQHFDQPLKTFGTCKLHDREDPQDEPCIPAIREMAAELEKLRLESDVYPDVLGIARGERDALLADKQYLRDLLYEVGKLVGMDSFNAPEVVAEELAAAIVRLRAEVARKVEPLSDEERDLVEHNLSVAAAWDDSLSADIRVVLDRMQGKQGGE